LLGGQPAAGKTHAQEAVIAANPDAGLVPVTGDDLREYHPDYAHLAEFAPLEMPGATAPVSGGLIRLALDHALAYRYSVLLEGTFRDPSMVTATAARFADAGYRVQVLAVGTPAPVSRLSAERRSLGDGGQFGRWTPPEAHEVALAGSPGVVTALEAMPVVSRVQVYSRDRLLYDNVRSDDGTWRALPRTGQVLQAEQTRPLTPADAEAWLARYHDVFADAMQRPGYLCEATTPAYQLLQHDAAALIPVAGTDPSIDAQSLWRDHHERQAALARAIPSERTKPRTPNRTIRVFPANQPPPPISPQGAPHHSHRPFHQDCHRARGFEDSSGPPGHQARGFED
jgi:hypothetical protein